MNKNLFIGALILLTTLLTGCREEGDDDNPAIPADKECTLHMAFSLQNRVLNAGYTSTFNQDDALLVYDVLEASPSRFTVTDATPDKDNRVTATGTLSSGTYATRAVFPAHAVISWSSLDSCLWEVPSTQTITADLPFDGQALVYAADVERETLTADFHSMVALVQFQLPYDCMTSVVFTFNGGEGTTTHTYTLSTEEGTFSAGKDYYAVVHPGMYQGIDIVATNANMHQTFTASLDALCLLEGGSASCSLGTLQLKMDMSYRITSEITVPTLGDYANQILIFKRVSDDLKPVINQVASLYFDTTKPVHLYCYEYPSVDPDGNPATLSAALLVPQEAISGEKAVAQMLLGNHFSSMRYDECPTLTGCIEGLLAWKNAAVVLPDYYGFGSTGDQCQAYLDPETNGRNNLDALMAGRMLLEDLGTALPATTLNVGYSQGGYNAMADLRYLTLHPEYGLAFDYTVAGGGPYNVMDTFVGYLGGGFESVFPLVLVTLTSFNELEHLGIDYSDMFKEPLLSHYQEWILSKKYDSSEVSSLLGSKVPGDHLTEQLISLEGPIFETFAEVADRFSVSKGWTPDPKSKITLLHCRLDDMVPYTNFVAMEKFLNGKCDLKTKTIEEPQFGTPHAGTYLNFFMEVLGVMKN